MRHRTYPRGNPFPQDDQKSLSIIPNYKALFRQGNSDQGQQGPGQSPKKDRNNLTKVSNQKGQVVDLP
jgi:hypothetical protein